MTDNDSGNDSLYGDSVYESGVEDAEDFDPIESLTGDDAEEPLDTGYSPPDYRPSGTRYGTTDLEQAEGESLDQRIAQEEPDITADIGDSYTDFSPADPRAGRLVAPDEGAHDDTEKDEVASDVGRAGYAASAEESAMHIIDPVLGGAEFDLDAEIAAEDVLESDTVDDEMS